MITNQKDVKEKIARLESINRFIGLLGLAAILFSESIRSGAIQNLVATSAVVSIAIAAGIMFYSNKHKSKENEYLEKNVTGRLSNRERRAWRLTLIGLGLFGFLSIQLWFQTGTAIAVGDITPPIGTAWIHRLFVTYDWSGGNLGGLNPQQVQLPWAAVRFLVHVLGGSGALAQRIWLSGLVAAIWVGMGSLVRSLKMSPTAGIVAATLYFFNPAVVSNIGANSVFMVAMVLLTVLPATLISYGCKRISIWKLIIVFIVSAPLLGFAYSNPPLVGMIIFVTVLSPFIAGIRFDKQVRNVALFGLWVGALVIIAVSSYWIIPSLMALHGVASKSLSAFSGWSWTEERSTLANAFWLNTSWGWNIRSYYPYAVDFSYFPLNLIRSAVPVLAFSGIAMRHKGGDAKTRHLRRLHSGLALLTLVILFISTGTRTPGDLLFDVLYGLPYGWLLREPGRFLMLASLGYALLVATLLEELSYGKFNKEKFLIFWQHIKSRNTSPAVFLSLSLLIGIVAGFPIWTGAIIPAARKGFPSVHVKVPTYWHVLSNYLNSRSSPSGSLLVLPPNDFYQMPYTWYYGNDGFIVNMLRRNVLLPSGQGYNKVSNNLLSAVKLEASSLLSHNWNEANYIMTVLGTPLILVRGDIQTGTIGRNIVSPKELRNSLRVDPLMQLVKQSGPLSVYRQRRISAITTKFSTINIAKPDLKMLSLFSGHVSLVRSPPIPGHVSILQLPALSNWRINNNHLFYKMNLKREWIYKPILIRNSSSPNSLVRNPTNTDLEVKNKARQMTLRVPLGRSLLPKGTASVGNWGSVGNCNYSPNLKVSSSAIKSRLLPHAGPNGRLALSLKASSAATACESRQLNWSGGSFLLTFWSRSLSGYGPSICVLEEPSQACAGNTAFASTRKWQYHQISITPTAGTQHVYLFFYARSLVSSQTSKDQYSDVSIKKLPWVGKIALLGKPITVSNSTILTGINKGFSSRWLGPKGATHVQVDGLLNGWLVRKGYKRTNPVYLPSHQEFEYELALVAVCLMGLIGISVLKKLSILINGFRRR